MTGPRLKSGARLHPVGDYCYAVLVDLDGNEISERHTGQMWVAFPEGHIEAMFIDQHGGSESRFTATRDSYSGGAVVVIVDGDVAIRTPVSRIYKRGELVMNYSKIYDLID